MHITFKIAIAYRGNFTDAEFYDGIAKSRVKDECLENACKILFMHSLNKEPVTHCLNVGPYGHLVCNIPNNGSYGVHVPTAKLYLLPCKPKDRLCVTVNAVFGDGYWYLTGPSIENFIKSKLNSRIPYPQNPTCIYLYDNNLSYDEAAWAYLMRIAA